VFDQFGTSPRDINFQKPEQISQPSCNEFPDIAGMHFNLGRRFEPVRDLIQLSLPLRYCLNNGIAMPSFGDRCHEPFKFSLNLRLAGQRLCIL